MGVARQYSQMGGALAHIQGVVRNLPDQHCQGSQSKSTCRGRKNQLDRSEYLP